MASTRAGHLTLLLCSVGVLAACEKGGDFNLFKSKDNGAEVASAAVPSTSSVKLVERDVEVPEVFQASDAGLWDGRPSLGGVWVAHPDVTEPERVIIRNEKTGKFVIGALFRRERDNPGPRFQVSSDAAAALGMLAGAPDALNVTALRRQEVPVVEEAPAVAEAAPAPSFAAAPEIETASLDPLAAAGAALDKVEAKEAPVQTASATPMPNPAPAPASAALDKPVIQIGLFSLEENATNTGIALRNAGMVPTITALESKGKKYWRVTVGPAQDTAERTVLMKKVQGLGFQDAYFVTR